MIRVYWRRNGLPTCTQTMLDVLKTLETARQAGDAFIHLTMWKRTEAALVERDWIVASPGLDGVRYKITGRGQQALTVYSAPSALRNDGLCPRCGQSPRHVYPSGRYGYCYECGRKSKARTYRMKRAQVGLMGVGR